MKGGVNRLGAARAAADGTSTLTFDSLSRDVGSYLWVDAEGLGTDNRNRIKFTTAPATVGGLLPPWLLLSNAVAAGRVDLAEYDTTDGLRAPTYVDGESTWATNNARPTSDQTLTNLRDVNALVLDDGIDLLGPTADRNLRFDVSGSAAIDLQTGGFSAITNNGNNGYNLWFGANTGMVHTLGDLWITRGNDNGATLRGSAGFIKSGPGMLILQVSAQAASANPFTGILRVDEGVLQLRRPDAAGGAVMELNGGTLMIVTNNGVGITSQDATPTNTPLVVSQSGTVLVARAAAGGGVTHTMGNLTLNDGVQLTLNYGANFNTDSSYGVRFDTMTLLGDATLNVRTGPGIGDGTLTATNVTDLGAGRALWVVGNSTIWSELRVVQTLNVSNLVVGPATGSGGAVVATGDGFTNVTGNIGVQQGVLGSAVDVVRELGSGPGQVQFEAGVGGTAPMGSR